MDLTTLTNIGLLASTDPTIIDKIAGIIIVSFLITLAIKGGQ